MAINDLVVKVHELKVALVWGGGNEPFQVYPHILIFANEMAL